MSREYQHSSTAELASLVDDDQVDRRLLVAIKAELDHRKTQRARDLAVRVEQLLSATPANGHGGATSAEEHAARGAGRSSRTTGQAALSVGRRTDVERRYAALRETFTSESERLASWGMTSLMPPDLRAVVADAWRKHLRADPASHPLGLRERDLDADADVLGLKRDDIQ